MNTNEIASRIAEKLIEDHDGRNLESIVALDPETQDEIRSTWREIIATELKPLVEERDESNKKYDAVEKDWAVTQDENHQLRAQLAEAQELLRAAREGQPLGPIIGAQTMLNQDNEIRQLKAQLASEQEKGRKAREALGFYASIDTYLHGCLPESGGHFADDFEDVADEHGIEYYLPGKRARQAQAALRELEATEKQPSG